MKCDIFVLAEGATNDARGALALVGVNQRAISVDALPFRVIQKVVIGFTDEVSGSPGSFSNESPSGDLSIKVIDPEGNPQFAINQSFQVPKPAKPRENIPVFSYVVADVIVSGTSHGMYTADVSFRCKSGEVQSKQFLLYVAPVTIPVASNEIPRTISSLS